LPHGSPHSFSRVTSRVEPQKTPFFIGSSRVHGSSPRRAPPLLSTCSHPRKHSGLIGICRINRDQSALALRTLRHRLCSKASVYLDYYGLTEPPFDITPNPRFLFYSAKHREAFNHLLYGIRERKGFVQLTGEVGAGKSTLCRAML